MKRIHHVLCSNRDRLLHIETEGGIINITIGLHNTFGNEVTSISFVPDSDWEIELGMNTRFIRKVQHD